MSESVRLRAFFLLSVIFYGKIRIENLELLIFLREKISDSSGFNNYIISR